MNTRVVAAGLLMAVVCYGAGLAQTAKPLDEPGLVALLGLGLDDETVVARIKKGPLALEPSDALLDRLRTAGTSEALIRATTMEPRGNPAAALFFAMTYAQQGELDLAHRSLAADLLDQHRSLDPAIIGLRSEAKSLLATPTPQEDLP